MRERKFRAWDSERKEMARVINLDTEDCDVRLIDENCGRWTTVYPYIATVMEYTTMKDNNQNEIYEGDIVEFLDYEHDEFWNRGVVVWSSERLGFDITNRIDVDECEVWHDIKVVGNIFENKELLDEYISFDERKLYRVRLEGENKQC